MTVSEMLDMLEGRIARLGAERARLAAALENAERRLRAVAEAASPEPPRKPAAKKSRRDSSRPTAPASSETAVTVAEPAPVGPADAPARPSVGKRIALGRGLAQLRARPVQAPPAPESNA